jgi:F420-dependent oxidoreductase-like protein
VRIGISGGGSTVERAVAQAVEAERDGLTSLWYTSGGGDPLALVVAVGLATSSIELGTAVLPTYLAHPALMAQRAATLADVIGRPFTLGIGPSHQSTVEGAWGLSFARAGLHTEEYVQVLTAMLEGHDVDLDGEEVTAHTRALHPAHAVPVLLAALAPRLLRVAGERTAGTVTWMANATAIATHVAPRLRAAADAAGRPAPRIVAGLPIAVHDDVDEARAAAAEQFGLYGRFPIYQRILAEGGLGSPAEAAIVGDEAGVTRQLEDLLDAGATDLWVPPFAVGADRAASRERTRALLVELAHRP